jgi:hypothetical protein
MEDNGPNFEASNTHSLPLPVTQKVTFRELAALNDVFVFDCDGVVW